MIYPYTSPIILTDAIYQSFNGDLPKGTQYQRQYAYTIAEEIISEDLNTFLLPTNITGTFQYAPIGLMLDYGYVNYVSWIKLFSYDDRMIYQTTGSNVLYLSDADKEYGRINLAAIPYICYQGGYAPVKAQIAYNTGFPTGTANGYKFLMALTTYADIILNEMVGYGNEAPGDIGVQSYSNQQYRETRIGLFRTNLGSSPRAMFASRMLTNLRKHRYAGI